MSHNSRPYELAKTLAIGQIYEVDGNQIRIELDSALEELTRIYASKVYSIGQFGSILQIPIGKKVIFAMVTRLTMKNQTLEAGKILPPKDDSRVIFADLFGEGVWSKCNVKWELKFERGVSEYPLPLQSVYLTEKSTLAEIYQKSDQSRIKLGTYVGSGDLGCFANISTLIGKHTAILGSTGTGKSTTTASVIHSILNPENKPKHWSPQIIILDPHGEYKKAFSESTVLTTDDKSLRLPYWLLNFQETVELFIGKTEFVATSQSNILKKALLFIRVKANPVSKLDSPVPYKISELKSEIIKDRDIHTTSAKKEPYEKIIAKIELFVDDARFNFLMNDWDEIETLNTVITPFIQIKKAPTVIDLSGVPDEVAGICNSAIARVIFSCKIWQKPEERQNFPTLLVCEEAHRYVPNKGEAQYGSAQMAIQRIAKEGRKYGIGLFLVSQRPSEIDDTVLSQCSSWIVLRLTNTEDRNKVASVLPDSLSSLTKMLSGLRNREAIFAGLASDIPARIRIRDLDENQTPASNDVDYFKGWSDIPLSSQDLTIVIKRWERQSFIDDI